MFIFNALTLTDVFFLVNRPTALIARNNLMSYIFKKKKRHKQRICTTEKACCWRLLLGNNIAKAKSVMHQTLDGRVSLSSAHAAHHTHSQ